MMIVFTLGFWIVCFFKDIYLITVFSILFALYLLYRFRLQWLSVLFVMLCLLRCVFLSYAPAAQPGEYRVYDMKTHYVLARNNKGSRVVLYGLKNPQFYDVYKVDHFESLEGSQNIGVFSFPAYMAQKHIYYSSYVQDSMLIERSDCLKNKIYSWMVLQDNPVAMRMFYGMSSDEMDFINKLGIPVLAFLSFLQKQCRKKWDDEVSCFIVLIAGCLFSVLFTMTPSLCRWLCFRFGMLLLKDWNQRFVFSFFLFGLFMPECLCDFSFVFPTLLSLSHRFIEDVKMRKLVSKFILLCCNVYFFGKIDFIMFFFFGWIRKLYAGSLIFVLFSFIFPNLLVFWKLLDYIPSLQWHYDPDILFVLCVACFLVYVMKNDYKKSIKTMMLGCVMVFVNPYLDPFFSVYMIDIGQGDCTLIVEPFHKSAVMIDVGQNLHHDNVELFVEPFLKQKHIHCLDALIVTHNDFDHSGGVDSLQDKIKIKQIIRDSDTKIPVEYPFVSLLSKRETTDENSKSIVSYFSYDHLDFLWTGDAGIEIEEQLLKQYDLSNVDVLKLGHHGSKTSSSFEFLDHIRPELGLVSAGKNNRYGHPDSIVMSRCHDLGIHVLETKDVGMIQIKSWHRFAYFKTANHLTGLLKVE